MKSLVKIAILLQFILFISSCKKDDDSSLDGASQSGETITASISGFVRDVQGNSITGAMVTAGGKTAITNSFGGYMIQNASVGKKRALIEVNKPGYVKQQKAIIAEADAGNRVDLVMFADDKQFTVNAVTGGVISMTGGTTITFPASAFMTISGSLYTGTVYITAHEILTSDTAFAAKIPGGDLMAIDNAGEDKLLESYGMAGAELYDAAGNSLQLAPGKSATVKFPVSSSQMGVAPAIIPLWHYDEDDRIWKEEGAATRSGNFYEGSVSHFSWWNCDIPREYATLTIKVKGCEGNPLVNEELEVVWIGGGQSLSGWTNSSGTCTGAVPANVILMLNCYNPTGGLDTSFTIGPFGNLSTPQIQISLPSVNCNSCHVLLTDCNGSPVNGLVQLRVNNTLISSAYAIAGSVMINNLSPGTYSVYAFNNLWSNTSTITISSSGQSTTVLNLQLCDAITNPNNGNFIMQINNFPTSTFHHLIVQECDLQGTNFVLNCVDSITMEEWSININNSAYNVGTYPWNAPSTNGVLMTKFDPFSDFTYNPISGNTLMDVCTFPGGFVSGSYSGTMIMDNSVILPDTVQVTADFNLILMK